MDEKQEFTINDLRETVDETINFIKKRTGDKPILIELVLDECVNYGGISEVLKRPKSSFTLDHVKKFSKGF